MWRTTARVGAIGIEMGLAVGVGYGLGWWLDDRYGTAPYFAIGGLILGIATAFRGLVRVAIEGKREADQPEPGQEAEPETDEAPEQQSDKGGSSEQPPSA